jgi:hypothetical protein
MSPRVLLLISLGAVFFSSQNQSISGFAAITW